MYYLTAIPVRAPATTLWRAVASVTEWPQWTPTVEEATILDDRELGMGARVRIRQPKLRTLVYQVDEWINGTRFVWSAGGPGFRISAGHIVQPQGESSTLLLTITMTGALAPLLTALAGRRTRRYVNTEGAGLGRFAEHLAAVDAA